MGREYCLSGPKIKDRNAWPGNGDDGYEYPDSSAEKGKALAFVSEYGEEEFMDGLKNTSNPLIRKLSHWGGVDTRLYQETIAHLHNAMRLSQDELRAKIEAFDPIVKIRLAIRECRKEMYHLKFKMEASQDITLKSNEIKNRMIGLNINHLELIKSIAIKSNVHKNEIYGELKSCILVDFYRVLLEKKHSRRDEITTNILLGFMELKFMNTYTTRQHYITLTVC